MCNLRLVNSSYHVKTAFNNFFYVFKRTKNYWLSDTCEKAICAVSHSCSFRGWCRRHWYDVKTWDTTFSFTSCRGWKMSYLTLWRHSFDMTISHMAVSQTEAMRSFKYMIKTRYHIRDSVISVLSISYLSCRHTGKNCELSLPWPIMILVFSSRFTPGGVGGCDIPIIRPLLLPFKTFIRPM